jgi:ligand-binding SRPBCC domain-containing protein
MASFQRSVHVDAPLEDVWDFHSDERGLVALTPDWMNLRVEHVEGPDGELDVEILVEGSRLESSVRPFGVGPRQQWVSLIAARERGADGAYFRDTMEEGPFPHWEHTHAFEREAGGTLVTDHVEYELPLGPLGRVAAPLSWIGFEPMFRYRHRETKRLLE